MSVPKGASSIFQPGCASTMIDDAVTDTLAPFTAADAPGLITTVRAAAGYRTLMVPTARANSTGGVSGLASLGVKRTSFRCFSAS